MENDKNYVLDIRIASDYYSAYLIVEILDNNGLKLTEKAIENFLEEKNIVHGIQHQVIEDIVENPESGEYLIAKGKKHVNGESAQIEYKFDTTDGVKPEINEDGSVDYKDLHLLRKVHENQLLATKTPVKEGSPGYTVTGKQINPKLGKDKNFRFIKNVRVSEDGLKLYSEVEGAVNFENEKISVVEILELPNGVGVQTGNIKFHGKVVVYGNVQSGYTIETNNDLIINGIVEEATLKAEGNIEISKGIQGNDNADIIAGGDLKAQFINNSHVNVDGDIYVDIIMHSKVISNGQLIAQGRKGTVVGGEYIINKGVEAKLIGSEMGTITKLEVGIDKNLLEKYKEIRHEIDEKSERHKKISLDLRTLKKRVEEGNRNQMIVQKLKTLNKEFKKIDPRMKELKKELTEVVNKINQLKGAQIKANKIYPGIKIEIARSFYNVKEEMYNVIIKKEGGQIKIMEM